MKTYYYRDPNGTILSDDGKVKYGVLTGKQIYDFFQVEANKQRTFIKVGSDDFNEIWFEVEADKAAIAERAKRRERYVREERAASKIEILSLDIASNSESGEDQMPLLETIDIELGSLEDAFLKKSDEQDLLAAIERLNESDRDLIVSLYLREKTLTEQEFAVRLGVSHQAIHKRKKRILKKLKNYLSE